MFKIRVESLQVAVRGDIFCNKCGHSCQTGQCGPEYVELKVCWGFDSQKDGEKQRAHLCESCYDELVVQFVIPVEKSEVPLVNPLDPHDLTMMRDDHQRLITQRSPD